MKQKQKSDTNKWHFDTHYIQVYRGGVWKIKSNYKLAKGDFQKEKNI